MRNHFFILCWFVVLIHIPQVHSKELSPSESLQVDMIASGLGVPWGMAILPDNTLLISQREGTLSKLNLKTGELQTITGLPAIRVDGQGGLFDVALSPDYASDKWLYFSYNKDVQGQGATTLARARLHNQILVDWHDLLVTQSTTKNNVHFGGRITFDHHGHVFLSVGERGIRTNAQNLSNHAGSILRLNLDGSVPDDNPFVGDNNALAEIWSYGHRNPQGLFFNQQTQQLWAIEHGPRGGDEINLIKAGKNYGWPVISYGMEYWGPIAVGEGTEREGMEQPIKTYIPSIAPSSLIQYTGSTFPNWHGSLLAGALKSQHLNQVILNDENKAIAEYKLLRSVDGRIRNIIESPEGWLYISTDNGRILRVKPNHSAE
ncbi:MAG: PQQ-dependent sugar dehydrogenase [Gammaproteobacteria bacterium]|nr:PQQ-dependent sugar dehydrogenase [Gammaproteobacteria bacterium]MDH5592416.1 PQQ-dependent sugar dehydrogenase [Gammaproteobacteria bacterium]